jgi:hypothetical protein
MKALAWAKSNSVTQTVFNTTAYSILRFEKEEGASG